MQSQKINEIKWKNEYFIWLAAILIGAGLLAVFWLRSKPGSHVVIEVDGTVMETLELNDDTSRIEKNIQGINGGTNLLIIEDGKARIEEASCPDKLCVHQGRISKTGESIVCLPNRVVVKITDTGEASGREEELDAIAK